MDQVTSAIKNLSKFELSGQNLLRNGEHFLNIHGGELWIKNPEENDIADMIHIANQLEARVRGDEFETYDSVNHSYIHPEDVDLIKKVNAEVKNLKIKTRRNTILLNAGIILFFLILLGFFHLMGWLN